MTYKKYRNKYFKYFRKLGLDFKTCIEIKTVFHKNNDIPLCIDQLCEILDNHGYKHTLEGCTFDDLERYGCKYYDEYWLHDESYLLINNTIKVPVGAYDNCGNDFNN